MLAPLEFPKWLPSEVAQEVERIECSFDHDAELVRRLATDKRMRLVWSALSKRVRADAQIREAWLSVMKDRVDVPPPNSPDRTALVLFFWLAYTIASLKVHAGTYPKQSVPISQYNVCAAELRLAEIGLRKLDL